MEKNSEKNVYWTSLNHSQWNMYIAATTEGLCYIGTPNAPFEELEAWVNKRLPSHTLTEEADILQPHAVELVDYLKEQRRISYCQSIFMVLLFNKLSGRHCKKFRTDRLFHIRTLPNGLKNRMRYEPSEPLSAPIRS